MDFRVRMPPPPAARKMDSTWASGLNPRGRNGGINSHSPLPTAGPRSSQSAALTTDEQDQATATSCVEKLLTGSELHEQTPGSYKITIFSEKTEGSDPRPR